MGIDSLCCFAGAGFDKIAIEFDNVKRSYSISETPISLAITIAKWEFDPNSAESQLMQGAVYAVDEDENNRATALSFWIKAGAAGADISELILSLEDDYYFAQK